MIVSTRPLIDCCPVLPAAMEGRQLCQWDKDSCADAGFLNRPARARDAVGGRALRRADRPTRGERVDLSRIPYDDEATYAAIQEADTMGVFQIESRAQMQSLRRTRPETLDDLTIQVAIVRRGRSRRRGQPVHQAPPGDARGPGLRGPYDHPALEPVLQDTLGTIIFQDQVIEVAMAFAASRPARRRGCGGR